MVEPGARGLRRVDCSATPGPPCSWRTALDYEGRQAAAKVGASYAHLDVTSEEEWDALIADVVHDHGGWT